MNILIVDSNPILRMGMKSCLLQIKADLVLDEASTLEEATIKLDKMHFDLVLLSLTLSDSSGIETAVTILERPSAPNVAVYASHCDEYVQAAVMDAAARALIKMDWPLERQLDVLAFLLRGIDAGGLPYRSPQDKQGDLPSVIAKLSPRKRQILALICRGCRNKEIGRTLQLEENTVKAHVRQILRLLGATSRIQAALMAGPPSAERFPHEDDFSSVAPSDFKH